MKRKIDYKIEDRYQNHNIEFFLKDLGYSHAVIVSLKKTKLGITLNGEWAYTTDSLNTGDTLSVLLEEHAKPSDIEPVDLPIQIVYEDEDIMVIDKPANMPIHPSINNHSNTLANAIMYHFKMENEDFVYRCINRLDRDTTGLTIIAKHSLSAAVLSRAITNRQIHRTYWAICQGKTLEKGQINAPIARKESSTIERCVDFEKGESAITNYALLAYDSKLDLSLVELKLETGRTHQIRVHMKYIGHPLIGDFLYNPDYSHIKRQALHSKSLSFRHPVTGNLLTLEASLPLDMQSLFSGI